MQGKKGPISKEQILSTIRELAKTLGRTPTREELERLGGVSGSAVRQRFFTHRRAVRAAGLEPAPTGKRYMTDQELLESWGAVARKLGKTPTQKEYDEAGRYSSRCVVARFERWSAVPAAFAEAEAKGAMRGEWKDVLEIARRWPARSWSEQMRRVRGLGRATIRKTKRAMARWMSPANAALPPLANMKCVTATMLTALVASMALGGGFLRRGMEDRPLLGPPMHAAGLAHEPVNEMGVSMLFAMKARELGFIIESVQPWFPDCRAKMEVLPGKWQDVRIEFEKDSRGFAEHGHDPKGADMIVCWRHNWKGCPKEMMVLELRKVFSQRQHLPRRHGDTEEKQNG